MSKKIKIEDVCVSMDDLHEIELGFYSTNKVGTLWSVLYFYCNWQLSAKKQNNNTGVGGNGSHSSGSGTGFSPSFFVGLGREESKVCDAFWKQEMSPWSNAPPGLRNPFSKTYF